MHKPKKLIAAMTLVLSANVSLAQFDAQMSLADIDGSNGVVINGVAAGHLAGYSVSYAGDVNGDGIDDVIIGAPSVTPGGRTEAGACYVVFGSDSPLPNPLELSSLNGSNGFVIEGVAAFDKLGLSVSDTGDVNGDGLDDVIIGAFAAAVGPSGFAGKAYVIFGKNSQSNFNSTFDLTTLDGDNGFVINGEASYNGTGLSVSTAGDINGDGFDDILVGAPYADTMGNGDTNNGRIYVILGNNTGFAAELNVSNISGGDGTTGFVINGVSQDDFAGAEVSNAGDVNNDGFDDIIIGVKDVDYFRFGVEDIGSSYVVFGKDDSLSPFTNPLELSALDGNNGFAILGVDSFDRAGKSVSAAGDINGDGIADLLVGASGANPTNSTSTGAGYVVYGKNESFAPVFDLYYLTANHGTVLRGESLNDLLGYSISQAGDLNADGVDDLIVGARGVDSFSGRSYVVFGNTLGLSYPIDLVNLDGDSGFAINAAEAGQASGAAVSHAGDFNADGIDDIIIGAFGTDSNGSSSGSSYIVYGREKPIFKDGFE